MKLIGWFGIAIGVLMVIQWSISIITKQVPEINTVPVELTFHLIAELGTSIMLIFSGFSILSSKKQAYRLMFISLGMLIYSIVNAAGYFAQLGNWIFVLFFIVLISLTVICIYNLMKFER